ncbi:MAG: ATP-binding protein [Anaerolineales bacterium]
MWNQDALEKLIKDQIQEGPNLEYKAADALGRSESKMKEITKDVSAMANSSGGILIYGIKEFAEEERKHLPEKLDPVDQTLFSREWLEQVINNIRPKIPELNIYPINLASAINHVVYVIEVVQSSTAHQATDYRYYKRFNFLATPMEDYEVRDVMNCQLSPDASLTFGLFHGAVSGEQGSPEYRGIRVILRNESEKVITRVKVILRLNNIGYYDEDDMHNELVEHAFEDDGSIKHSFHGQSNGSLDLTLVYQPNEVLFPKEHIDIGTKIRWSYPDDTWEMAQLNPDQDWRDWAHKQNWKIQWKLYADNMLSKQGVANVWELPNVS